MMTDLYSDPCDLWIVMQYARETFFMSLLSYSTLTPVSKEICTLVFFSPFSVVSVTMSVILPISPLATLSPVRSLWTFLVCITLSLILNSVVPTFNTSSPVFAGLTAACTAVLILSALASPFALKGVSITVSFCPYIRAFSQYALTASIIA